MTFVALPNDPLLRFITRSLVAALVIPDTVAFSYAGAFGLSILVWQHLIGLHLHWLVLPLTFIILVAVGSVTPCCTPVSSARSAAPAEW